MSIYKPLTTGSGRRILQLRSPIALENSTTLLFPWDTPLGRWLS